MEKNKSRDEYIHVKEEERKEKIGREEEIRNKNRINGINQIIKEAAKKKKL